MKTNYFLRLWQVVLAMTLWAATITALPCGAQDGGDTSLPMIRHLHGDGLYNPLAPDVSAIIKYGDDWDMDLFTGAAGFSIPVYSYQDEQFTIPVSFSYASTGYKPNIQTGVLGLGWFLNAGGAITREVRGIIDEEQIFISDMYEFQSKWFGYDLTSQTPPWVKGYGELYQNGNNWYGNMGQDYFKDFVYYAKAGSEYFPVWNWNYNVESARPVIETQPDIFHFSFLGRKGSFILQPCGSIVVFDTEDSSNNYTVSPTLNSSGFTSFTITTEDNTRYEFSRKEEAQSSSMSQSSTDVKHTDTWRLTRIEAANGRQVLFLYGNSYDSYTYDPTYLYDYRTSKAQWDDSEHQDDGDIIDYQLPVEQFSPTENTVRTSNLQEIRIDGRASILFSYSTKSVEVHSSAITLPKLDSVVVRSLISNQAVRKAVCTYSLSGCSRPDLYNPSLTGVTFLHTVSLSGEGTYTMDYYDRSATFPPIDTYSVDWFGYYNPSVSQSSFMPSIATAKAGTGYLFTMRQPSLTGTMMGMLSSVLYPTGGYSTFEYEQNTYSTDNTGHNHSGNSYPTGGVRIKQISSFDADSTLAAKREFSYLLTDGKSSGSLYWLPMIFSKYKIVSSGFDPIERTTLSSSDNFPYSKGTHVGYSRVLETSLVTSDGGHKSISENLYQATDMGDGRDTIEEVNDEYEAGYFGGLGSWFCRISAQDNYNEDEIDRVQANIRSRGLGRLLSRTVFSDALTHPSEKTAYAYAHYSPFPSDSLVTYETVLGYDVTLSYNFETFYKSHDVHTSYGEAGTIIRSESVQTALDNNYRPGIRTYSGTESDDTVEEIEYFPNMPSLVSERLVTRGGRYIGGEHWDYQSNNTHPTFYFPREVSYANTLSSVNSDPLFEEELEWEITSETGLPLQVKDRSGRRTCYVWEYGGACLAMKVEGATLSQAGIQGVYSGALPASADAAARAVSGARVTTWTNLHLVGITSEKDPSGRITRYTYDSAGRIAGVSQEDADGLGQVDLKHYDYNIKNDNE